MCRLLEGHSPRSFLPSTSVHVYSDQDSSLIMFLLSSVFGDLFGDLPSDILGQVVAR